ncbi:MAG TPA: GntR family transcriptional regulator [Trebonia sp.]
MPSRVNGVSAYRQIALALQRRIDEGEWGAGGQLPTEPQLTAEFGVNRLTIRQAVADLERAGSVIVRQGKGIFVAPPFTQAEIAVDAASQKMDMGSVHLAVGELTEMLYERVVAAADDASPEAGSHLRLPTASIQRVDTVIGIPGGPASVLTSYWFDKDRFSDLVARWTGDVTLPVLLRAAYGIDLSYDWRGFSATAAGLADSEHLQVAVGHPLLVRDGVSVDASGVPVYYLRRRYPGERVKFVLRFHGEVDLVPDLSESLPPRSPQGSVRQSSRHLDDSGCAHEQHDDGRRPARGVTSRPGQPGRHG